ncbi:MAG TPA: hypothetical protein VMM55_12690 [Thermohalobaculum sp.]|nr:hypothetical protein [Thermohalobaculum sp.]
MHEQAFASLDAMILMRALERVSLVLVGALAIYLGYSLFRHMPSINRSEGKLELPGGVSIFLSRIGPGAFFALFGCLMIGYSVTKPVSLSLPVPEGQAIDFSGIGEASTPRRLPSGVTLAGLEPEVAVGRLNGFLAEARASLSNPQAEELEQAVRAAKFALMLSQWKPEWGERAAFERWVEQNGDKDPPDDLVPQATVVYRTVL